MFGAKIVMGVALVNMAVLLSALVVNVARVYFG